MCVEGGGGGGGGGWCLREALWGLGVWGTMPLCFTACFCCLVICSVCVVAGRRRQGDMERGERATEVTPPQTDRVSCVCSSAPRAYGAREPETLVL